MMEFALYQSSKLLWSSPSITHEHRLSGTDFWRLSDILAKSGTVSKKLNRLGFSQQM